MSWTHRFMVIPDANRTVAKALAKQIAPAPSADGLWDVGLNASGVGTSTHWISSGLIDSQFASLLGNASATHAAYTASGGSQITLAQIQALYTAAVIRSDAQGQEEACIQALNLKLIRGTL